MSQANQGIEPPWNFASFMLPATSPYRHREGCSRNKVRCLQIGSCLQSRGIKKSAQIVEPAENNAAVIERIYPFCPPVCEWAYFVFKCLSHFILFFLLFFFIFIFHSSPSASLPGVMLAVKNDLQPWPEQKWQILLDDCRSDCGVITINQSDSAHAWVPVCIKTNKSAAQMQVVVGYGGIKCQLEAFQPRAAIFLTTSWPLGASTLRAKCLFKLTTDHPPTWSGPLSLSLCYGFYL